ncbi:uncharacterized protein LOC121376463 [Gigantopelta aegis]|uniref:uncharacterized protein LOC121376463 n=1 Tax=Gigantopelta aegis TaxID=1735272 RepID=UPI001B88A80A|nr:uncharacterized protein LOC121376463 [Gigantopelta aegis]
MADVSYNGDNCIEPEGDSILGQDDIETEGRTHHLRNPNTMRKTAGDVRKFVDWLRGVNERRQPEHIPLKELDEYMANFLTTARKLDGQEYEIESLKSFQCSINRYLIDKQVCVNVLADKEFKHSREVLLLKRRELRRLGGKAAKQNKAEPFTAQEINLLYASNLLGTGNPRALLNTVFLNNTLYFGMESRREHVRLRWGDIQLKTTSQGVEFLEYSGGKSCKPKPAIGNTAVKKSTCTLFADPENARCPVQAYRIFAAKRPKDMLLADSSFYTGIVRLSKQGDHWYSSNALGKNTVGKIVRHMCEEAGIVGRKMNHTPQKVVTLACVTAPPPLLQLQEHLNVNTLSCVQRVGGDNRSTWCYVLNNVKQTTLGGKREHAATIGGEAAETPAVQEKVSRLSGKTLALATGQGTTSVPNSSTVPCNSTVPNSSTVSSSSTVTNSSTVTAIECSRSVGKPESMAGFSNTEADEVKMEDIKNIDEVEVKIENVEDDDDYDDCNHIVTHTDSHFNQRSNATPPADMGTHVQQKHQQQKHHHQQQQQKQQQQLQQQLQQHYACSRLEPGQSDVANDIAKIETDRLAVEQERLNVARERLELEKQLLQIERERVRLERQRLDQSKRF